jgi:glycosyltransferase involved in cell wall biosynthesis
MALGVPIIGLATTEMATAVENGRSGYVDTSINVLIERMAQLLDNPSEARRLSEGARETGRRRFNLMRFTTEWDRLFTEVARHDGGRTETQVSALEPLAAGRSQS